MKRLYLTHKPSELAMAAVQFECVVLGFYMASLMTHWIVAFIFVQVAAIAAVMCWVFLFTMSGSRERREAAEKAGEVHAQEASHG